MQQKSANLTDNLAGHGAARNEKWPAWPDNKNNVKCNEFTAAGGRVMAASYRNDIVFPNMQIGVVNRAGIPDLEHIVKTVFLHYNTCNSIFCKKVRRTLLIFLSVSGNLNK